MLLHEFIMFSLVFAHCSYCFHKYSFDTHVVLHQLGDVMPSMATIIFPHMNHNIETHIYSSIMLTNVKMKNMKNSYQMKILMKLKQQKS